MIEGTSINHTVELIHLDPSKCMASDFYSSDQAGTAPFSDPSARVHTYAG